MSNYKIYQQYRKKFPAWKIPDIDSFFVNELGALSIPMDHPGLVYEMTDDCIPPREQIVGLYALYKQSTLDLLKGNIENIHGMGYTMLKKGDYTFNTDDDVESILESGVFLVLHSEDGHVVSPNCFIGGRNVDRIYNLVTFFSGLPEVSRKDYDSGKFKNYESALRDVQKMGFFDIELP